MHGHRLPKRISPTPILHTTPVQFDLLSTITSRSTGDEIEEDTQSRTILTPIKLPSESDMLYQAENSRIIKNVIHISVAFTLLFSAFYSMANLQSSINISHGLGTMSLGFIYLSVAASSLFLPAAIIRALTVKWTMVLCMLSYSLYIMAQFHPRFYTLIPAGMILGLCSAPMWTAQSTYLSHVAHFYNSSTTQRKELCIIRIFGIFFLFFETTQLWGNLVSSWVLSNKKYQAVAPNDTHLKECGVNFCLDPHDSKLPEMHFAHPAPEDLYTLSTIYLLLAVCAPIMIAVNVDSLTRYGERTRTGSINELPRKKLFIATFSHLRDRYKLLLIPLSLWCGFQQAFIVGDYTQAFVSCAYSIHQVGYVMMTYGVIAAMFCMSLSTITEIVGRIPVFTFGASLNIITITIIIRWYPTPTEPIMFYTVAGLWGMCDAVWQTQLHALYGSLFVSDEEIAFSCYRLFESLGFALAYLNNPYFCIRPKLYTMVVFLTVGMVCYYIVESLEHHKKKKQFINNILAAANRSRTAPLEEVENTAGGIPSTKQLTSLL